MVDVVIPHYGPQEDLDKCISSFEHNSSINEIIVIDNNKNNIGFTAACNQGIKSVLYRTEHPYVAIVNNDTESLFAPFDGQIKLLQENPNIAITGPKILKDTNRDQIIHAGGMQAFPAGVHKTGLVSLDQCNKAEKVKWLSFVVVLMRKEAIVRTGLMDEHFFLIGSDSDYCYRFRYDGFGCMYCPDDIWTHKVGESGIPTSQESIDIQRRDMFRFYKKWISNGVFKELELEVME